MCRTTVEQSATLRTSPFRPTDGEQGSRRAFSRALAVLAREGVGWVKLEVREGNEPALALYREFGFELRRQIPRYYADGETALVMVRSVEP